MSVLLVLHAYVNYTLNLWNLTQSWWCYTEQIENNLHSFGFSLYISLHKFHNCFHWNILLTFKQLILFDIVIGETSIRTDAFDYDLSAAIVDDYCVLSAQLKTCLSLSITCPNLYEFVKCALMFSASEGRFNHRST